MALGTNRTRNWCKEAQLAALATVLKRRRVAHKVETAKTGVKFLMLAGSDQGMTLPFETVASLHNTRRGRWEAQSFLDGRVLATGVSERDVIRATIQAVWQ